MRIAEGISNAIADGCGLNLDEKELREKHYLELRSDKDHFVNPQEEEGLPPQRRAACFALTAEEGEAWAKQQLTEAEAGQKCWRPDWLL
jgi:hypothetical protein